jgi:putative protease
MEYVVNLFDPSHVKYLTEIPIGEVLIQPIGFCRTGRFESDAFVESIDTLSRERKKMILSWNSLSKESTINQLETAFEKIRDLIDVVRVTDPGIARYLREKYSDLPLHLSLEYGPHNRQGIKKWAEMFSVSIDRIILSNQIPLKILRKLCYQLSVEAELLVMGKVETLYTHRLLLRKQLDSHSHGNSVRIASSDRPDELSEIIENNYGTVMFYQKDLFTLDRFEELAESGIKYGTVLFDRESQYKRIANLRVNEKWRLALRDEWREGTTSGFLTSNQSDKQFSRLTNTHIRTEKEDSVGVVLESIKQSHTLIEIKKTIFLPCVVTFVSPEGVRVDQSISTLRTLMGEPVTGEIPVGYYLSPAVKYVVPSSILLER